MPIQATVYILPNGRQEVITVTEITDDDALWFTQHNVKLSMEELRTGAKVIYADYGNPDEEAIVVSMPGRERPCIEMMTELRKQTETSLAQFKLE